MTIEAQGKPESSIEFRVAEEVIEVAEEHLTPLLGELEKLERDKSPYEASEAAARIRAGLRPLVAREPLELSHYEAWALLRAIEHLRQFSLLAADLLRLREALQADLGLAGIEFAYLLRHADERAGGEEVRSCSGPYTAGDRLVAADGRAWRIRLVEIAAAGELQLLIADPWPGR